MKKIIFVFLISGLIATGSILAQHGSYGHNRGVGKGKKSGNFHQRTENPFRYKSLDRIYDKRNQLNLTAEQVEKIKNLIYEFRTSQVERKADIEKARINLRHLKSDKSAPVQSIMDAIDKLSQSQAEAEKARYRFQIDIHSNLTEEQLKKLEKLRKTRRSNSHRFLPEIERQIVLDGDIDSQ